MLDYHSAETLTRQINQQYSREFKALRAWRAPGLYVVVITVRAANTQHEIGSAEEFTELRRGAKAGAAR